MPTHMLPRFFNNQRTSEADSLNIENNNNIFFFEKKKLLNKEPILK